MTSMGHINKLQKLESNSRDVPSYLISPEESILIATQHQTHYIHAPAKGQTIGSTPYYNNTHLIFTLCNFIHD